MTNSMESRNSKRKSPSLPVGDIGNCRFRGLVSDHPRTDELNKRRKHSLLGDPVIKTMGDPEDSLSDTGSSVSIEKNGLFAANGLVRLEEGDRECNTVKKIFISGLGPMTGRTTIADVYKNTFSSLIGKARLESFGVFSQAIARKCGSSANIKYAWFGASREEIDRIITYGFAQRPIPMDRGSYGYGLHLSPQNSLDAIKSSAVDERGMRHVLLCRVILGKLEVIPFGSSQIHPSSSEFDSGVDNLQRPEKYIVWATNMNSHVLPEFVISFKAPFLIGSPGIQEPVAKPRSPWMPFPALISILSRSLPPNVVGEIEKNHAAYRAKKITRNHLVQHVRQLAGDRLLMSIIKSYREKEMLKETSGPAPNTKCI